MHDKLRSGETLCNEQSSLLSDKASSHFVGPSLSQASHFLIFSYVNLSPYLITFGDGLRLYHVSSIHDSTRSGEHFYNLLRRLFRRTFAAQIYDNAWFPSSCKLENPATS